LPEIGYQEFVSIVGQFAEVQLNAKIDTGADRTSLDMDIAARVGAGPIVDTVVTHSASGSRKRILARVKIQIRGKSYTVNAAVEDRSKMSSEVVIGRDILETGRFSVVPRQRMPSF
jgi:hypothetical protein